ncbi:DNA topoisomerase 2 [Massospora cicadina]|nr:DNA topoisomerase 2 [Massospora cicadina]
MSVIGPPKITKLGKGEDKFQMNQLNADIVRLLKWQVYDTCAIVRGVSVFLNDSKLKLNNFKDHIQIGLSLNESASTWQLQQVSFINSISTSKGYTHINYVVDVYVKLIQKVLDKKKLKSKILPGVIKGNILPALVHAASLQKTFQAGVLKSVIINMLTALSQAKDNMAMVKALDFTKSRRILGIPKLEVANKAGTQESDKCTLILTEGESSKVLKLLSMMNASPSQVKGNKEFINLCKIMGLNNKADHSETSFQNSLFLISRPCVGLSSGLWAALTLSYLNSHGAQLHAEVHQFCPGTYIDQNVDSITYTNFINKKLIHFFIDGNIHSIPSMVNIHKLGQRKVVYGCFLHPDAEVKVAMLTGKFGVNHHWPCPEFYGVNNVNLLTPLASLALAPRIITQLLFYKDDMPILNYLDNNGMKVESKWFVLVVPIVLINGCDGIDVVFNLRQLMQGESPIPMLPWYLGFIGDIEPSGLNCYILCSHITKLNDRHLKL